MCIVASHKKGKLQRVIIGLLGNLVSGGIIYASWKHGDKEIVNEGKYFYYMTEQTLIKLFKEIINAIELNIWISYDAKGRDGEWISVLLKKER